MGSWFKWMGMIGCGAILFALGRGCDRPVQSTDPQPIPVTARQTLDKLRSDYERGAYMAMRPHIASDQFEDFLSMLLAVDELLGANRGALDAVRQRLPGLSVDAIDLAPVMRNNLGLFSMDLRVLDVVENADAATITVQIDGQNEALQFRHDGGIWVYLPGDCPADMTACLRQIATSLNRLRMVVLKKNLTAVQVQEEYDIRILPKLKRAAALAARL